MISIIVAMDENRGIGYQEKIPWKLSTDLKRFRALTIHHHIIMGRKTYESIGHPLPDRINIILTRQLDYKVEGCVIAHSLSSGLKYADQRGEVECFVIGGSGVYQDAIELADKIYLTMVHAHTLSDVFFPEINQAAWEAKQIEYCPAGISDQFNSTYMILVRSQSPRLFHQV